ncbi:MAG: kelch repeat-containing protein [Chloroflexi bacterium]|nr:kelch repeat-containing protein [Chloroflexota bacterium]
MNCRARVFVASVVILLLLVPLSLGCGGGKGSSTPSTNGNNTGSGASTSSLWTRLSPTGTAPAARQRHASVYDAANDRLIVFGGMSSSQCFNDTWVLTNASGAAGSTSWISLATSGMTAPARYSVVAGYNSAKNILIVFGGVDSSGYIKMDLWLLTNANGLEGTAPTWFNLVLGGTAPSTRLGTASAYDEANDNMIFFGGGSYAESGATLYDEIWVIRDVTSSSPSWCELSAVGTSPSARRDASAVYDAANNRMIVFGGNTSTGNPPALSGLLNDTWVLSNANGIGGTPTWSRLNTSTQPAARAGRTAGFDSTNKRMLVFAGGGADGIVKNDVWVLTNAGETTSSWAQYDDGTSSAPAARAYHSAVYAGGAKNRMIVFGGNSGGGNLTNDVWVLRCATGIS